MEPAAGLVGSLPIAAAAAATAERGSACPLCICRDTAENDNVVHQYGLSHESA